jgi:hypothetical protein
MSAVIPLGALSALIGFVLGKSFPWPAIAAFSLGLAVVSAIALQMEGFDAPSGIALGVACMGLSQIAYLGGSCVRHPALIEKEADKEPHDRRDNGIAANQRQQQKRPTWFA